MRQLIAAAGMAGAIALSACYGPWIPSGAPCDPARDTCPEGMQCTTSGSVSVCLGPGDRFPDAPAPTSYAAAVLADQPSGYWRLDDRSATVADASGHGATGSIASGVVPGAPGALVRDTDAAMEFDGQSGSIALATGFAFTGTAAFSIEAWIKPAAVDVQFRHVFTKEHRTAPRQGYALLVQAEDGIAFERFVDDGSVKTGPVASPPTTSFTHVVVTYDGALIQLYVNGQRAKEIVDSRAQTSVTEPAQIGAASPSDGFFDGTIDEVAVYPDALPAARVLAHYQAGSMP